MATSSYYLVSSVLVILVCFFEYSRGYTFGKSLAVARVNQWELTVVSAERFGFLPIEFLSMLPV